MDRQRFPRHGADAYAARPTAELRGDHPAHHAATDDTAEQAAEKRGVLLPPDTQAAIEAANKVSW